VVSFDLKKGKHSKLAFHAEPEELKQSEIDALVSEIEDAIRDSVRLTAY